MTRLIAFGCGLALLVNSSTIMRAADAGYDREMASRYSTAARAGDDRAQFYLGALYSLGIGVGQSDTDAFGWILQAAQQGHSEAMLVLAGMLAVGRGTLKDNVTAYKWAYIVSQGSRTPDLKNGASQLISLLETRMNGAEIAKAKSDAIAFRATQTNSSTREPAAPAPAPAAAYVPNTISPPPPPQATVVPPTSVATPLPQSAPITREMEAKRPQSRNERDSDVDRLLDNIPPNIRKRFGF
jgi:TPR repeat protein